MNDTKVRFKGFEFSCNPRTLSIKQERNIVQFNSPITTCVVQDLGIKATVITGDGELFGKNVLDQFDKLSQTFKQLGVGILYIPGMKPINSSFCSLTITAKPSPDLLYYSFKFMEVI